MNKADTSSSNALLAFRFAGIVLHLLAAVGTAFGIWMFLFGLAIISLGRDMGAKYTFFDYSEMIAFLLSPFVGVSICLLLGRWCWKKANGSPPASTLRTWAIWGGVVFIVILLIGSYISRVLLRPLP